MAESTETDERTVPGYRVAFFTNTYKPFVGGVAMSTELYQRHLTRLGDTVLVYAPTYHDAMEDGGEVRRLPAIRHFNNTDFSLPLPYSFKAVLDFADEEFDIVHVHHPFLLGEMGMSLAREHRLPLVFTYHTQYEQYTHYVPLDETDASRTIIRHAVDFCNHCDLVIAPTSDVERMLRFRGVESRIEVQPTGIELERFAQVDSGAVRNELGISAEAPVLLHVGRMAKEKNLEYLLKAGARILQGKPEAHFIIVGDGPSLEDLQKQAGEEGADVAERIHFLGRKTGQDLIDAYGAGDLFLFSSKSETQGMVIAEAMAAGMPAVALDADGVRDVLENDRNGRLLPGDATEEAYAIAVLECLNGRDCLDGWRDGARQTANSLDMPILARQMHGHYASLKLLPNHQLKRESISFGLIRNYFETVWENVQNWFAEI